MLDSGSLLMGVVGRKHGFLRKHTSSSALSCYCFPNYHSNNFSDPIIYQYIQRGSSVESFRSIDHEALILWANMFQSRRFTNESRYTPTKGIPPYSSSSSSLSTQCCSPIEVVESLLEYISRMSPFLLLRCVEQSKALTAQVHVAIHAEQNVPS